MTSSPADDAPYQQALALHKMGQYAQAAAGYLAIAKRDPRHFDALHMLGLISVQAGNAAEALTWFDRAALLDPAHAMLAFNRGLALLGLNRLPEAVDAFDSAIRSQPGYAKAVAMRANALTRLGRVEDAQRGLQAAIAAHPGDAQLHLHHGSFLYQQERYAEASGNFEQAATLAPLSSDAHANLGCTLIKLEQPEKGLEALDRAIALNPDAADSHVNRGIALGQLGRYEDALASFSRALDLAPSFAEAWQRRGLVLARLKKHAQALADLSQAVDLQPDHPPSLLALAQVLAEAGRLVEADRLYEQLASSGEPLDFVLDGLVHTRMKMCDWRGFEQNRVLLERSIPQVRCSPTALLAVSDSAPLQKVCAEAHAAQAFPTGHAATLPPSSVRTKRIRIGYFSSDFHEHATAYLMAGMFEHHDRNLFDVTAFSFGHPPADTMHERLRHAFEGFFDVSTLSDQDVVTLAREKQLDIAVDLKGLTQNARPRIFSLRAAPIQVSYLGYPGTMGMSHLDYLIADKTLIEDGDRQHYTEKIVRMPHSYQVNDGRRAISSRPFTRSQLGLPEQGFVFCCFNNPYKITPSVFDVWMRLLHQVAGSCLWLFQGHPQAVANLQMEAQRRGIAASRLVFAPYADAANHLARHQAADLVLDTLPYNAHTTASDALWAGIPLVTCAGDTFASRVGASLLNAAGLAELVTRTLADYEALALRLATRPPELQRAKAVLASNRLDCSLFNTGAFTSAIEAAFVKMRDRLDLGLGPDHLDV